MSKTYEAVATAVPTPLVEVVAPATLEEGYSFEAIYQGQTLQVVVPKGGVTKGQKFEVPVSVSSTAIVDEAPRGYWKDDICDCFSLGVCHAAFLNALCFPQILMAQVMTRMQLNVWGLPGTPEQVQNTFKYVLFIVILYTLIGLFFPTTVDENGETVDGNPIYGLVAFCFMVYSIIAMTRTRKAVREHYSIPEKKCCGVPDDCCYSFWCGCCTVNQMAKQTTDYQINEALCCTETGLRRAVPVLVV